MKPNLRLTWRLAPYMLSGVLVMLIAVLMLVVLVRLGVQLFTLYVLIATIYMPYMWKVITQYMGGNELASELKVRRGKPIKVFLPGKKNCCFLTGQGWGYEFRSGFAILVNPRLDKRTLTKHLFLLDPSSTDFSDQLLEVAVTNEKAFQEISDKVRYGKYHASSDLRKFEAAMAISETIQDIMK